MDVFKGVEQSFLKFSDPEATSKQLAALTKS